VRFGITERYGRVSTKKKVVKLKCECFDKDVMNALTKRKNTHYVLESFIKDSYTGSGTQNK